MTSDAAALAARIYAASHLTGSFLLRSGQTSDEYFDKYLFESDPLLLEPVAAGLVRLLPPSTELLAGLELGGVPLATALSLRLGLPAVFVRKQAKEYGTRKLAEGIAVQGRRLCIIEDVVTTGGQIVLSAEALRALGATVTDVLCVIERDPASRSTLAQRGLALHSLYTMADLSPAERGGQAEVKGSAMTDVTELEEGDRLCLDFAKLAKVAQVGGVLPCAVQHSESGEVILVAYVNEEALRASIAGRKAVFWSTSRNELWEKGKTSGDTFELDEIRVNCEQNSLLYRVRPVRGDICHTRNSSGAARNCFYRRLDFSTGSLVNLNP